MGIFQSKEDPAIQIPLNDKRFIFLRNFTYYIQKRSNNAVYSMEVYYQRYVFVISKTLNEFYYIQKKLLKLYNNEMNKTILLQKFNNCFIYTKPNPNNILQHVISFFQTILDNETIFQSKLIQSFLGLSKLSLLPELGSIGKEGYLRKASGGYIKKYSQRLGDMTTIWSKRYFIFKDNHFAWYNNADKLELKGVIQIDQGFSIFTSRRHITITTNIRVLKLKARNLRDTEEWRIFLKNYYDRQFTRKLIQPYLGSFPIRESSDVKMYTVSKDYMFAVAIALLNAQKEILISSWKLSPQVYLTKHPHPYIRLDQILKYKADQGVKIYVLLYKEVELVGQGNDSMKAMNYLESLSSNIKCIRHPNKFLGGSTAIMWSHHEKLVIVDRNLAFVGGIDMAVGRWDNEKHNVVDEYGIMFPDKDYRQQGPGKYQTAIEKVKWINYEDDDEVNITGLENGPVVEDSKLSTNVTNSNRGSIANIADQAKSQLLKFSNSILAKTPMNEKDLRDLYPRTAWHDVHCSVTGLAARDVASHFVKRWNHHRVSTGYISLSPLVDVTDNAYFGICAKCQKENINEYCTNCPSCQHDLGPISYFLKPISSELLPQPIESFQFITFECAFRGSTGCVYQGDGPVIISQVFDVMREHLISNDGHVPQVGDIVISINDLPITGISHIQFSKVVSRIRLNNTGNPLVIRFRRYVDEQATDPTFPVTIIPPVAEVTSYSVDLSSKTDQSVLYNDNFESVNNVTASPVDESLSYNPIIVSGDLNVQGVSCKLDVSSLSSILSQELYLSISTLYYQFAKTANLPVSGPSAGTCQVQVLRSLGSWSAGCDTEQSILNAYRDAILNSHKFVYIENQFFIGNLAGPMVENSIASAILERILQAVRDNEDFKVIVIIPQHPSGDIAKSVKPRTILHYEYQTISRGEKSLLNQLRSKVPLGTDLSRYISFYCLRSYGVISNQVFSDQVYVHDKVLIVDDRIAIIGSANINDRSMIGDRDSEVALRIEDTEGIDIWFGKNLFRVGKKIHEFRIQLMSQHVAYEHCPEKLVNIIDESTFQRHWHSIADINTTAYDEIDGPTSVYKCETLNQYLMAIEEFHNPFIYDPAIKERLDKIRGFLLHWPINFLLKEDISPNIALRAVCPTDLWV